MMIQLETIIQSDLDPNRFYLLVLLIIIIIIAGLPIRDLIPKWVLQKNDTGSAS